MPGRALRGVPASPGVALGVVHHLGIARTESTAIVPEPGRAGELRRASRALESAADEVEALAAQLRQDGRVDDAEILATGALMARDPTLLAEVAERIEKAGASAESAIMGATGDVAARLAGLDDLELAARADDVRSIGRRAVRQASGREAAASTAGPLSPAPPRVVVADEMGPADVAELDSSTAAVALASGGVTAHAAIVARSLGLPMVVGVGPELLGLCAGDQVVVDADAGSVLVTPSRSEVADAQAASDRRARSQHAALQERELPTVMADGHAVVLRANASSGPEIEEAMRLGAAGVGLLRTELSFLDAVAWPTCEQHLAVLRRAIAPLRGATATVRLLDFGGDKTPPFLVGAPGRGIELLLQDEEALRAQLSALALLAGEIELKILIPMVTEAGQVRLVRSLLQECLDGVAEAGRAHAEVGAMIEVPAAATMADELAQASDFLCIGTNDLSQFQLGVDRGSPGVAPAHHPAVLRLVDATVQAGRRSGRSVGVCGESASDPLAGPLLLGLGVDTLSVGVSRIGYTRRMVRSLEYSRVRTLALTALKASSAAEVEELSRPLGRLLELD